MISTFNDHPQPAIIQIPTGEANGEKLQIASSVTGMDGKRLIMQSCERISMSTPVSVEYNDAMFLGEVMLCKATADGHYHVEIFVEQILTGLQSLMALRTGLLGETAATSRPKAVVPASAPLRRQS